MKKFLSNLYVMIGSIILTVVATAMLIAVLTLPLLPVGSYYGSRQFTIGDSEIKREEWIDIDLNNTATRKYKYTNLTTGEVEEGSETYWYYTDGEVFFTPGLTDTMTKEDYKEVVKDIKEMSDTEYEIYKNVSGARVTFLAIAPLYNTGSQGITVYKNKAKVPTLITVACVDTALLALTATSIVFFVKSKKGKK